MHHDQKNLSINLFIGLNKAFDSVDYNILAMTLDRMGIRGTTLKWLMSCYLKKPVTELGTKESSENICSD